MTGKKIVGPVKISEITHQVEQILFFLPSKSLHLFGRSQIYLLTVLKKMHEHVTKTEIFFSLELNFM